MKTTADTMQRYNNFQSAWSKQKRDIFTETTTMLKLRNIILFVIMMGNYILSIYFFFIGLLMTVQ